MEQAQEKRPIPQGMWMFCKRCKKKLIKKMPNGLYFFEFGKKRGEVIPARVSIQIDGDIKIRCLNPECTMDNVFTKFPRPVPPNNSK